MSTPVGPELEVGQRNIEACGEWPQEEQALSFSTAQSDARAPRTKLAIHLR